MAKQVNTEEIIKSIMVDEGATSETLDTIKVQRFPQSENAKRKKSITTSTEEIEEPDENKHQKKGIRPSKTEIKLWEEFNKTLNAEFYRDKKDTFLMSLSGECLAQYEKLSIDISYKLGKKISRNDIIRKVLEHFMMEKMEKLRSSIMNL